MVTASVARWVQPGAGHGGDRRSDQVSEVTLEKVSPTRFAEYAGPAVSRNTVNRHLKAWNLAANNGHVPPSERHCRRYFAYLFRMLG